MPAMHFDAVFNRLAAILLANLGGFLLHKRREAIESSRDALASLLLCFHQCPIKLEYLFVLGAHVGDRKSTRLNSSHRTISYAVFCLKKKKGVPRTRLRAVSARSRASWPSSESWSWAG